MSKLKIYKASAGSGKTYTLALEYIHALLINRSDHAYSHILAVTFTKDATGEMKDRILSELYGLAYACKDSAGFRKSIHEKLTESGKPMSDDAIQTKSLAVFRAILHDYGNLHITTIDSFFQKVLRNLARELGKGSRFNLEMNSSKVLAEAVRSMIEQAGENQQLLDWLTTYIEGKLDEGVNWRIDKEILNFSRCIFDEYFQEHEQILKMQLENHPEIFTELWDNHLKIQKECRDIFRKAYEEVDGMMSGQQLELADFSRNGTVINLLKKLAKGDFSTANPGSKTVEDCCTDPAKWAASKSKRKDEILMLATMNLMPLLNRVLDVLAKYNTSRMITQNIHQLGLIWDITGEISRQNTENNRFMLADTALFLNRMIDESDAPFIYEKIGAEIRHVMIDEFQDTSRMQWKNFKYLLSNILANNDFSLIVGDVKQSIYRWRNGDWNILNGIGKELNTDPQTLGFNFRSEKQIIDFNNQFFTHAANLLDEKYSSLFGETEPSPFLLSYNSEDVFQQTHKKENSGYVSINFIPDKTEDEKYDELVLKKILDQLQHLKNQGIPASQICILTRTNKNIIKIAEYLASCRQDYPGLDADYYLNVVSNEAFQLSSSPAVRIIVEALHVLNDPENPVHKVQLQFFLEKAGLAYYDPSPDLQLQGLPLFELIGYLYRMYDLKQLQGQSGYMYAFYDAVGSYLNDYPSDIYAFLNYWDEELQLKSVPSGMAIDGIRAMTIHKSKGLQFHTVLVPYCDWDIYPEKSPVVWCGPKDGLYELELLPVRYNHKMYETVFLPEYKKETGQSWMDNLNLLYVAFTRAECNLLIIGKSRKKLASIEDMKNVSDLLRFFSDEPTGNFDENELLFQTGELLGSSIKKSQQSDNLLKQDALPLNLSFISESFDPGKPIFKQSNKSREFINPESGSKDEYVAYGNVMHELFARIKTMDDIDKAVDYLCFDGLIVPDEKQSYADNIRKAIDNSGTGDWFSPKYTVYNECAVIIKENDEVTTKRPDRVLLSNDETIIVDYKFGEQHKAHEKQMKQYISLMKQMNYKGVRGYIWYVGHNRIDPVA